MTGLALAEQKGHGPIDVVEGSLVHCRHCDQEWDLNTALIYPECSRFVPFAELTKKQQEAVAECCMAAYFEIVPYQDLFWWYATDLQVWMCRGSARGDGPAFTIDDYEREIYRPRSLT